MQRIEGFSCQLISLPARYYAWRMGGNAISLMSEFDAVLSETFDVIIATSMVDLASLKGFYPHFLDSTVILYCHENQFEYPAHKHLDKAAKLQESSNRLTAQMRHIYAALAADRVIFNSDFNRDTFLTGCKFLLKKMPDFRLDAASLIENKSSVVGIPLAQDINVSIPSKKIPYKAHSPLRIVWAARWEFDKGMQALLAIADSLKNAEVAVEWLILGQQFRHMPAVAEQFLAQHDSDILQAGFVESREEYLSLLNSADIVLSTSLHEFYGIAVLEAVACGCWPVLPGHQVYPEIFGKQHLYQDANGAAQQIKDIYLNGINGKLCLSDDYLNTEYMIQQYLDVIDDVLQNKY